MFVIDLYEQAVKDYPNNIALKLEDGSININIIIIIMTIMTIMTITIIMITIKVAVSLTLL